MVSPENIYQDTTIQTRQIIFRTVFVYTNTYMQAITIKKEDMNLKESREEYMGGHISKGRKKCN